jgi:hypothetical protein
MSSSQFVSFIFLILFLSRKTISNRVYDGLPFTNHTCRPSRVASNNHYRLEVCLYTSGPRSELYISAVPTALSTSSFEVRPQFIFVRISVFLLNGSGHFYSRTSQLVFSQRLRFVRPFLLPVARSSFCLNMESGAPTMLELSSVNELNSGSLAAVVSSNH